MLAPRWSLKPLLFAAGVALAGCGGGASSGFEDSFGTQLVTALASGQVAQSSLGTPMQKLDAVGIVKPTITDEQFFDWAEVRYPEVFPKGSKTISAEAGGIAYRLRYYPATGNFLGTVLGGTVYVLGPVTGGALQQFGNIESYICQVVPESCVRTSPFFTRVWISAGGLQCTPGSGSSLVDARRRLTDAGITVVSSGCGGHPDAVVPAVCGAPDLRTWIFDIDAQAQDAAVKLGFRVAEAGYRGSSEACLY